MTDFEDKYLLVGSEELSRQYNALYVDYYEFHREFYGFKPYGWFSVADQFENHAALQAGYDALLAAEKGMHDYFRRRQETFEGRESLREEGWVIEETDPQYMAAAAEGDARRKAERARREYECSYEYHLEQQAKAEAARAEKAQDDLESYYYNKYEAA
jgi:hypothetical protein